MAVAPEASGGSIVVRELEASLQQFSEFLIKARLVHREGGAVLRALGAPLPHPARLQ
jgi:hypothetical protein